MLAKWHEQCFSECMGWIAPRTFLLVGMTCVACATESGGGDDDGDPLRPQPIPELFSLDLDASRVQIARDGSTLRVSGGAGSLQSGEITLLVTGTSSGPLLQVDVADDGSFQGELDVPAADSIDVVLLPVYGAQQGRVLRLRSAGNTTTRLDGPCLTGSVGMITLGDASSKTVRLHNACGKPITLAEVSLREAGAGFTVSTTTVPTTLSGGQIFDIEVRFTQPAERSATTPLYNYITIRTNEADVSGGGVIVTGQP